MLSNCSWHHPQQDTRLGGVADIFFGQLILFNQSFQIKKLLQHGYPLVLRKIGMVQESYRPRSGLWSHLEAELPPNLIAVAALNNLRNRFLRKSHQNSVKFIRSSLLFKIYAGKLDLGLKIFDRIDFFIIYFFCKYNPILKDQSPILSLGRFLLHIP